MRPGQYDIILQSFALWYWRHDTNGALSIEHCCMKWRLSLHTLRTTAGNTHTNHTQTHTTQHSYNKCLHTPITHTHFYPQMHRHIIGCLNPPGHASKIILSNPSNSGAKYIILASCPYFRGVLIQNGLTNMLHAFWKLCQVLYNAYDPALCNITSHICHIHSCTYIHMYTYICTCNIHSMYMCKVL